ncbi:MAG: aminopeptidase N [Methylococcales bacterium]
MRDANPTTVYLKDYKPPEFLIDSVDLEFELEEENTTVRSTLIIRKNSTSHQITGSLELSGEELVLISVSIDGRELMAEDYVLSKETLLILNVPEKFQLETIVRINPKQNTALEGLYLSNGMFCTQCEAEGFRKITYFLDRPDVMARFTTRVIADQSKYPVLLSNGNPIDRGKIGNNRHWVKWEDPFKKPCYLFALIAGNLEFIEDTHTTSSGRDIDLHIYVEKHDIDKCDHAMRSLKKAMVWDEEVYGREYDLDLYMIVAVSHFNMGAMENKGLNIFNSKFVLARPDTATDTDYEYIEGVIAHEYFHNWTGNRITCRDWFQLSLKEGFTVFRDQEFSADMTSRGVKRIDDVNTLRTRQFAEDGGPMAHPIRPDSYIEINNFYTLTVYEKGAEVVRMIQTLVGRKGFRKGSDLYFERFDGQAITTDDFVKCMEDANQTDLSQFRLWYSQAGTPEIRVTTLYDAATQTLTLKTEQSCPATPKQPHKKPLHIPLTMGLLTADGKQAPVQLEDETKAVPEKTLELTEARQQFHFINIADKPVVSLLRDFSAPVKLIIDRSPQELAFLISHDTNAFCRWEAGQLLACQVITGEMERILNGNSNDALNIQLLSALRHLMSQTWDDIQYLALLLNLPSEAYLSEIRETIDPDAIHQARQGIKQQLAENLQTDFNALYQHYHEDESGSYNNKTAGRRRLKNTCLNYLKELNTKAVYELCNQQFLNAHNMTDQIAALSTIVNSDNPEKAEYLNQFYKQWQDEPLVIDKWFSIQATSHMPGTMDVVNKLLGHSAFDLKNPNRVRSLVGAFAQANPVHFHATNGQGYEFLGSHIAALNTINPQIASRLLGSFTQWRRYDENRQHKMKIQLEKIAATPDVSKDVYEVATKCLA